MSSTRSPNVEKQIYKFKERMKLNGETMLNAIENNIVLDQTMNYIKHIVFCEIKKKEMEAEILNANLKCAINEMLYTSQPTVNNAEIEKLKKEIEDLKSENLQVNLKCSINDKLIADIDNKEKDDKIKELEAQILQANLKCSINDKLIADIDNKEKDDQIKELEAQILQANLKCSINDKLIADIDNREKDDKIKELEAQILQANLKCSINEMLHANQPADQTTTLKQKIKELESEILQANLKCMINNSLMNNKDCPPPSPANINNNPPQKSVNKNNFVYLL